MDDVHLFGDGLAVVYFLFFYFPGEGVGDEAFVGLGFGEEVEGGGRVGDGVEG